MGPRLTGMWRRFLLLLWLGLLMTGPGAAGAGPSKAEPVRIVLSPSHVPQAMTFSSDGAYVATGGPNDRVAIWDYASGLQLASFPRYTDAQGFPPSLALSAGARRLAYVGPDSSLLVWDVAAREPLVGAQLLAGRPEEAGNVTAVAYSGDGSLLAVGHDDGACLIYRDDKYRKPRAAIRFDSERVSSLCFAPDGKSLFLASAAGVVRRFSLRGHLLATFEGAPESAVGLVVSDNGARLLAAGGDSVHLWDVEAGGAPSRIIEGKLEAADLSADGRWTLIVETLQLRLIDNASGNVFLALEEEGGKLQCGAFAASDTELLIGATGPSWTGAGRNARLVPGSGPLRVLDVVKGEQVRDFPYAGQESESAAISADGRFFYTMHTGGDLCVWSLATGQLLHELDTGLAVTRAVPSPDGHSVLVTGADRHSTGMVGAIYDMQSGRQLARLEGPSRRRASVAAFLGTDRVVTADDAGTLSVFPARGGAALFTVRTHDGLVDGIAAHGGSNVILTCSREGSVKLWDGTSGSLLRERRRETAPTCAVFHPDGKSYFVRGSELHMERIHAKSGRVLRTYPSERRAEEEEHLEAITCCSLSADGKLLVTGSWDSELRVWDVKSGRLKHILRGHDDDVLSASASADGAWIVSTARDRRVAFWSLPDASPSLFLSRGFGVWAAHDSLGRFDGSDLGRVPGISAAQGLQARTLAQIRERLYTPGLLALVLRGVKAPPPVTPRPAPEVKLAPRERVDPILAVRAQDRGGGIGPISVRLNGKRIVEDARGPTVSAGAKFLDVSVNLSEDPRVLPGQINRVEVRVANADKSATSRGVFTEYEAPGEPRDPRFWCVVCGVSDYEGAGLDLNYAAKDAQDIARAFRIAANSKFGKERVHVQVLSSPAAGEGKAATRANVLEALRALREADPPMQAEDTVVLYLAGHGVVHSDGSYNYLCADAKSEDLSDPVERERVALSAEFLTNWLEGLPAVRRQAVVLDTCAAGGLRDALRRVQASSHFVSELQDRTGTFVLAGCAANRASYESDHYGQGLLTYTLLFGLQCGCSLPPGDTGGVVRVDVRSLLNYAIRKVPEAASDAGLGVQLPVKLEGDASFDLGLLSEADRQRIPLKAARPRLTRSSFSLADEPDDPLRLGAEIDASARRRQAARNAEDPVVFVDSASMPGAYRVAGRYARTRDATTVRVFVYREGNGKRTLISKFEISMPLNKNTPVARLADAVIRRAVVEISRDHAAAR